LNLFGRRTESRRSHAAESGLAGSPNVFQLAWSSVGSAAAFDAPARMLGMRGSMANDLQQLTETGVPELHHLTDPFDPDLPAVFVDALKDPMPLDAVEAVERAAKDLFRQQLAEPDPGDRRAAQAFSGFFHAIGFLFKYKPYGVKAASPFGYSIFDLYPGKGFSFQLHLEPKYEAFHLLRTYPDSFVYLSTSPEWFESGERSALSWSATGDALSSPFSYQPDPGDVLRIASTEVVHSVIGATLEEYATTSLDAVERLLDQNDRSDVKLPGRHPDISEMVQTLHPDLPRRLVTRSGSGWDLSDLSESDSIIEVPDQMSGRRIRVSDGPPRRLAAPAAWVNVVVPTTAPVRCTVAGQEWVVSPGQLFAVPPAWVADVAADVATVIAVHSISPHLVLREWAR
jgi:hypothetical protein